MSRKSAVRIRKDGAAAFDRTVGARVRAMRQSREWTAAELAELLGYSEAQVCRYETGETRIEPATLARLGTIFKCRASDFIDGIEV